MFSRVGDRLKRLEAQIMPKGRVFVFYGDEPSPLNPDLPPYAEQLAAFKANNGVGPHDTLVTVVFK